MFCAGVNMKSCEALVAELIVGEHTLYCKLHCLFGLGLHKCLIINSLKASDVTGVMIVHFVFKLLTCENSLGSVDDDNEFTTVNMRCKFGSVLTAKNISSFYSCLSERLAGSIDNISFTFDGFGFCHKCRHNP